MEWVETTGRTVEEAKDAALDQLGVDEEDAEFEIVEEPRLGLFGRLRAEARVRARVRPTTPRPKEDRRDRRRRRQAAGSTPTLADPAGQEDQSEVTDAPQSIATGAKAQRPAGRRRSTATETPSASTTAATDTDEEEPERGEFGRVGRSRRSRGGRSTAAGDRGRTEQDDERPRRVADNADNDGGTTMDVSLDEQGTVARDFLGGLVRELNLQAEIAVVQPDDDTVEVNLQGPDLGLLIGPKGSTLLALQDITRTVVQRKTSASNGRLMVDVAGYRHKRRAALERFARQLAEEVRVSGTSKALEPMNAADRKVVHDAVNQVDGVATTSEGEDPNRRVVILPTQN